MHGEVSKIDLVTVGLTTDGQYLHIAVVTGSSLLAKLKSYENGHVLKEHQTHFLVL